MKNENMGSSSQSQGHVSIGSRLGIAGIGIEPLAQSFSLLGTLLADSG